MPPSPAPIYYRIQETLRAQIAAGHFAVGDQLPSETELAETFDTTRMTVRQALTQLTFEGLIERRVGRGTFVARPVEGRIEAQRPQSFEDQIEAAGARVTFRLLGFESEEAGADTAAALGIAEREPIFRLRRQRLVNNEIIGFEDRSMLTRVGAAIPAGSLATTPALAIVETALGGPLGGMSVAVTAEMASAETARLLRLRGGGPVLVRRHTFFDQNGRAVLTGASIYRGDRYSFTYRFGRTET